MSPLLRAALDEARLLAAERGWILPNERTIAEAQRLLELVQAQWGAPAVQAEPGGAISLEWEAGARGWLKLSVDGSARLEHSAVIEGDEYAQFEDFGDALPDWARHLLGRLFVVGH